MPVGYCLNLVIWGLLQLIQRRQPNRLCTLEAYLRETLKSGAMGKVCALEVGVDPGGTGSFLPSLLNKMVTATMHSKLGDISLLFCDSCAKASASEKPLSQAWQCTPVILGLVRPKQKDCYEVKVCLSYKK